MPSLRVRGYFHPPPSTNADHRGWDLSEREVARASVLLKGKPVYCEHNKHERVGAVERLWREPKSRALVVDLALSADRAGGEVMRRVKSGELRGLSIGFFAERNQDWERVSEIRPNEISIVAKGDMPGTRIFEFEDPQGIYVVPQHTVYSANSARSTTTMTEAPDQTTPASVPPERVQEALRLLEEKEKADAEREVQERKRIEALVEGPIHQNWTKLVSERVLEFRPDFGEGVAGLMERSSGRAVLECLASALEGNFTKLEAKRLEVVQKKAEVALASPEERKVPRAAALFSKPEPPAATETPVPVEVMNSASSTPTEFASLFSSNPQKRARVEGSMVKELNSST
jgi:hypothetical protein